VHPDHGLGVLAGGGDLRDRQRGGIRRENHVFSPRFFHVADHLPLEREVLEHSLDDDVGVLKARIGRRSGGLQHEGVGLLCREPLALHAPVDDPADVSKARHHAVGVPVFEAHRDLGDRRRDVRNACAHEAGAEHADLLDFARLHARVIDPGVFLQCRRREEDAHQVRGFGCGEQPAECSGLCREAGFEAILESGFHDVDDQILGGVVAAGLFVQLLARLVEEDLPADRVLREREFRDGIFVFELFDEAVALGRIADAGKCEICRGLEEDRRGDDVVDQAELPGLFGIDLLAGEHHVERGLHADEARKPLRAAGAGDQTELRFGETELGLLAVARYACVTGEGGLETTT
jgi:hypothetical protein